MLDVALEHLGDALGNILAVFSKHAQVIARLVVNARSGEIKLDVHAASVRIRREELADNLDFGEVRVGRRGDELRPRVFLLKL